MFHIQILLEISLLNTRQAFATKDMSNIHFAHLFTCKQQSLLSVFFFFFFLSNTGKGLFPFLISNQISLIQILPENRHLTLSTTSQQEMEQAELIHCVHVRTTCTFPVKPLVIT